MTTPAAPPSTVPGTEPAGARADLAGLTGRTRLPPALANASGMQKLDWIIGQPDPAAFVHELAPQELYYWIRDIGRGDAGALVELADREQKRALVDIDAWSRHELQLPRWLEWLDLAESAGDDTALDFVAAQDDETLEWLFSGDVTVHPADHDLDTVPDDLAAFHSPDGMYLVTVPREHELEERLPRLMKLMWAADEDRARALLQQVQFELRSNIASDMERFRDARIQDLGFEPQTEALQVWATLPVNALRESLRRGQAPDELAPRGPVAVSGLVTDLVLRDVPAPELLAEALVRMAPEDRARVGEALAYLVNKVFVADTGDLSRLDDLPITARHTTALVNLGLEHVADGSVEHAARVLGQVSPEVLFRAGNTLTVELGRRARKVRERAGAALGLSLLGTPSDEVLHGLALLRPLCFEGLDAPGRQGYRAFATLDELARAEVRVADAEAVLGFFEARFGFTPAAVTALPLAADVLARVRLATLFRTALAWTILRDEAAFEPLGRDELAAFARAAFERRGPTVALAPPLQRLVDGLAEAASSGRAAASEAVATFVRRALDELVEAVGGVRPDDLDPRFTGELFLVATP